MEEKKEKEAEEKTAGHPNVVLLEMQFTNRNLVPPSARRIYRNDQKVVQKREVNGVSCGEHGRADQVTVKPFVRQLLGLGYKISNLHFYTKPAGKTRFVLVVNFVKSGNVSCYLNKKDLAILTQLIDKDAWGYFHLWRNPNGVMSVHCLHRLPDGADGKSVGEFLLEAAEEDGYVLEELAQ